ncbi:sensor histidine kinase [Planctomycetota bacterium]
MHKRLIILSLIIIAALCGLSWLGYRAIDVWAQGTEGMRISEFTEVAEQIRADVKSKLDEFMEQEQNRPYTDYQYYYLPDDTAVSQQQISKQLSPLAGQQEKSFGYNNFQINPDNSVTTPNVDIGNSDEYTASNKLLYDEALLNTRNVEDNLLPILGNIDSELLSNIQQNESLISVSNAEKEQLFTEQSTKSKNIQEQNYTIESFSQQDAQVQVEQRSRQNIISNEAMQKPITSQPETNPSQAPEQADQTIESLGQQQLLTEANQDDLVEVRIEPFVPVIIRNNESEESIFGGEVFMLRQVQLEDNKIIQGFQLNEKTLLEEVEESTQRFIREGMNYELTLIQNTNSAYTAILDFVGLGHLMLNLIETNPNRLTNQINYLRNLYFGIVTIVFVAVTLAVVSLWLNARAQLVLAQKKDDFISAVSHELRTPLTSIRMHAEMLEKNWVKSEEKLGEYYSNMRQESERLSRLIENVLDFSRIQKGRKKYVFKTGDINKCVADVVEMMEPYATQKGFKIISDFNGSGQTTFDSDAVTQIVVNLLDNAIKYARSAEDKTIIIRTKSNSESVIIEVEDHGSGIPHRQRKKIFHEFYRIGAEATRETTGSGLGLALVKKFAQAHNGSVEILSARPTGVIFRVILAIRV